MVSRSSFQRWRPLFRPHWLILAGLLMVPTGVAVHDALWQLNAFGHLRGDIRVEIGQTRVYSPVTSVQEVSILLMLSINLWKCREKMQ